MIVMSIAKPCPSEHIEQREFVSWFKKTFPGETIFAIPNGGKRGKYTASKLKLEGVMPGVWDLFNPDRRLWIEFKRSCIGSLSKEQRLFGKYMLRLGYRCMVAYGCEDGQYQVINGERDNWDRPKEILK